MTLLPKPERTGPAPRKPIARKTRLRRSCTPIARVSRVRPMSRSKRSQMEREAATLASKITRRDMPYCVAALKGCSVMTTDAMHVCGKKAFPALAFELDNLLGGCRSCHRKLGSARLAGRSPMRALLIRIRGRECWERLLSRHAAAKTFGPDVLESLRQVARETGVKA